MTDPRTKRAEAGEMELRHLGRELKTATELGVVALCPEELLERLAAAAGLLEAVAELPVDGPPVVALLPKLVVRARAALAEWAAWQEKHLRKASV